MKSMDFAILLTLNDQNHIMTTIIVFTRNQLHESNDIMIVCHESYLKIDHLIPNLSQFIGLCSTCFISSLMLLHALSAQGQTV
jgi:hypothetical protein